jgi:Flp pilus assembly pilin Flp
MFHGKISRVMTDVRSSPHRITANQDGATAIEYGLIAALMALGIAGGIDVLADAVELLFDFLNRETAEVAASVAEE